MSKSLDDIIKENSSESTLKELIRMLYRTYNERTISLEEAALLASYTVEEFMELVEHFHLND